MDNLITTQEAWKLLNEASRTGGFPGLAYVLGTHALECIGRSGTRTFNGPVSVLYGVSLLDAQGAVLAGYVEEGMGIRPRGSISLKFIAALQSLHAMGVVETTLLYPPKDMPSTLPADSHFTCWPSLRNGVDWSEDAPLVWTLPEITLEQARIRTHSRFDTAPTRAAEAKHL